MVAFRTGSESGFGLDNLASRAAGYTETIFASLRLKPSISALVIVSVLVYDKGAYFVWRTSVDQSCEIDWFDGANLTPDTNPAIGRVRRRDFTLKSNIAGNQRETHLPAGRWMNICADHAKRMAEPHLATTWEWESEVITDKAP